MGLDLGRIALGALTGGASEALYRTAEQEAAESQQRAREEQERAKRAEAERAAASTPPAPAATAGPAVQRYQIVGEFLLDTEKGVAWRFDQAKFEFLHVPREKPPFEKSLAGILIALGRNEHLKGLDELAWKAPDGEKAALRKAIDSHTRLVDAEIKKLLG